MKERNQPIDANAKVKELEAALAAERMITQTLLQEKITVAVAQGILRAEASKESVSGPAKATRERTKSLQPLEHAQSAPAGRREVLARRRLRTG